MEKLLLNAAETSHVLGISKSTLFRLTRAKKINKINISQKRVAWSKEDILKFVSDCGTSESDSLD